MTKKTEAMLTERGWTKSDKHPGQWEHRRLHWPWPAMQAKMLEQERDEEDPAVVRLLGKWKD